jgi:hypothetical protein
MVSFSRAMLAVGFVGFMVASAPVFAQGAFNGAPNPTTLTPMDAAKINQGMQASDPKVQSDATAYDSAVRQSGHPATQVLDATKPSQ